MIPALFRLVAQVVSLGDHLVSVLLLVAQEAVVAVDSLLLQFPKQKIRQHIRLASTAYIMGPC